MADEPQERFDEFVGQFLAPLLHGERAQCVRFLPPGLWEYFAWAAFSNSEVELTLREGLAQGVSALLFPGPLPFPEAGAVATAMVGHNLMALSDPLMDRAIARGAVEPVLSWCDALIARIPPPATQGEALVRHAILEAFRGARREDTVVKNWAYTYRFHGRRPPANVTALPRLRFVREETSLAPMDRVLDADEAPLRDTFDALLQRSPVTLLLTRSLSVERTWGAATLSVLADEALRRGIAQHLVAQGASSYVRHMDEVVRAFVRATHVPPLAPLGDFLLDLHFLALIDRRSPEVAPHMNGSPFYAFLVAVFEMPQGEGRLARFQPGDREHIRAFVRHLKEGLATEPLALARKLAVHVRP